jgi:hypothetical protein
MANLAGLRIVSGNLTESNRVIEFEIIKEEKSKAIESLIRCIDSGCIVTLVDNRNRREGEISIKKENCIYYVAGGGHGFSFDWTEVCLEDIKWRIKITAQFNFGQFEGNWGKITGFSTKP